MPKFVGVGARVKLSTGTHATRFLITQTMSTNFGAGQGLFGNNQNKTQGTSTPGSTPAAGTSAFSGLTTSSSLFGGAGTGNTPGGGAASAPAGGLFGTGGSVFGGGGNNNTSTSTPSGAGTGGLFGGGPSLFAGVYASYPVFIKLPHASTTQQILQQIQGLRRQRQGVDCSQIQVRTQVLLGRRQEVYLAIPPAQLRGVGLEVRINKIYSFVSEMDPLSVNFRIPFFETCGLWREPLRSGRRGFHWYQWKRWQLIPWHSDWQHDGSGYWHVRWLKYPWWGPFREQQTSR